MTSLPINLSSGFNVLVKVGDAVTAGQVLAKRDVVRDVEIDLSTAFGVNPKKVKKYLKKNPGDSVSEGEVIAGRSRLLGMQEEKILSHVKGTISKFDRNSGKLSIVFHENVGRELEEEILSPIDGVVELCDNDLPDSASQGKAGQILIKTDKNVLAGVLGVGESVEAEVCLLEEESAKGGSPVGRRNPEEVAVQLHHLDTKIIDKILLGGVFDRDVLIKSIGMGVAGVIGVTIKVEDIEYVKERGLGTPIVTIDSSDFGKVAKWSGKRVFLNGIGKTILFLQK